MITPPTKPAAALASEAAVFIYDCQLRGAGNLAKEANDAHERLWSSPEPQAVLDCYGTEAAALFARHAAAVSFVLSIDPALIPEERRAVPPEWTATFHADGTVTLARVEPAPASN